MALCGQLVSVDKIGKVQMVHETAREFLLNKDLNSELALLTRQMPTPGLLRRVSYISQRMG